MRHRARGRKLGRTTAHRKALFRNQLTALFSHERIITTVAKAKELRPLAERMVTLARTGTLPARRRVLTMVPDKVVVRRLFDEIAPRFVDRDGGYTRIVRLGPRHGDAAELAVIEFVDYTPPEKGESDRGSKTSLMDRARGMFGGKKTETQDTESAVEPEAEETAEGDAKAEGEAPADADLKADAAEVEDASSEATEADDAEAPEAADEPKGEAD